MIHVVASKYIDFDKIAADAAADRSPGHVLIDLSKKLPTRTWMPSEEDRPTTIDRLRARIFSRPQIWALARRVAKTAQPEDTIFCTGEDCGLPVATLCNQLDNPPRIVVFAHNLARPRPRMALRFFRCLRAIDLWLTNAQPQYDFLANQLAIPEENIVMVPEQTDTTFFTPGPSSRKNPRPLIVSVGLECRDYHTLATATADLPVDVRISGFSVDASVIADTFPNPLPENMQRDFYDWPALRQLYRDADLIVVPVRQNRFCAGLTAMLEGLACQKPVIITRTHGLAPLVSIPGICLPVPPDNAMALRTTIQHLLHSPPTAAALAEHGRAWVLQNHSPKNWFDVMLPALRAANPAESIH